MNLDELNTDTRTKVLVYGAPKSGKTALVGKLAADGYTLHFFDLENGYKTLLNPTILAPEFRKNVNVISIPDHSMYPIAIDTIRDVFRGGLKKICQAHGKTNCPICAKEGKPVTEIDLSKLGDKDIIVIDSLSQLARSAMNRATLKERMKPDGESYKQTYADYAQQGNLIESVLSLIQVINLNVVVISHELESESLDGREKIVPVAGTRNFSLTCAKYFDSVLYCTVLNKQHRVFGSSTYSPTIVTGSRLPIDIDNNKEGGTSLLPLFKRP
jgi:hypothetical protein